MTSQQGNLKQPMVVGWKKNKIGRRSITVYPLCYLDGAFGDSQNSHGTFEMLDIDDTTQDSDEQKVGSDIE